MTRIHISANVTGERFNPSGLSSKWGRFFLDHLDAGATAKTGRYRGKASPFGFAIVGLGKKEGLEALVVVLEEMQSELTANGAQEISVFVTLESTGSANWEVSPEILKRLGNLPAELLISCP